MWEVLNDELVVRNNPLGYPSTFILTIVRWWLNLVLYLDLGFRFGTELCPYQAGDNWEDFRWFEYILAQREEGIEILDK